MRTRASRIRSAYSRACSTPHRSFVCRSTSTMSRFARGDRMSRAMPAQRLPVEAHFGADLRQELVGGGFDAEARIELRHPFVDRLAKHRSLLLFERVAH